MNVVVVVATIREENIIRFLKEWEQEFRDHAVIVVEDHKEGTFDIGHYDAQHYCWQDIDADLGEKAWIIPRMTTAIASYGIYKAWQMSPDMIVKMDDDCYPSEMPFLEEHYRKLTEQTEFPAWVSTIDGIKPRGVPFFNTNRKVISVFNHGLWNTNLDLDAPTHLVTNNGTSVEFIEQIIPKATYFPLCGMNIAFKPLIAPLLYFGLQGREWGLDRFDDIWCGLILKRICDHLGYWISSGSPVIRHDKASNVWSNLRKEVAGLEINESLWEAVDSVVLTGHDPVACFDEMADGWSVSGDYWGSLKKAMKLWASLFER